MAANVQALLGDELNILIICSSQIAVETLRKSILEVKSAEQNERPYRCSVHICKKINEVFERQRGTADFDYFVFMISGRHPRCLDEVNWNIALLGNSVSRHQMCMLVIDGNYNDVVKPGDIWAFATFQQCDLLHGSLENSAKLQSLGRHILNIVESRCGLRTGIPSFPKF